MAKRKHTTNNRSHQQDNENGSQIHGPRPFWSGVLAFGLVSIPVSLFPANRAKPVSLKMIDEAGTPLKRKFFCEKEYKMLERDDLVRGYEVNKNTFVTVEDKELEALAPEKSREIDLRRFVAWQDVDPVYFNRAYILSPDSASTKAYRLLAKSLEDEERVGIATFVMRGKEYIVAIIAENGILRAETLRFHDEIRTPQYVGLPELNNKAPAELAGKIKTAINSLKKDSLDVNLLQDKYAQRISQIVEDKIKNNRDVVRVEAAVEDEYVDESEYSADNVIDLMQVLKARLQGRQTDENTTETEKPSNGRNKSVKKNRTSGKGKKNTATHRANSGNKQSKNGKAHGRTSPAKTDGKTNQLHTFSREELYEQAKQQNISGRSRMSKQELIQALS